MQITCLYSLQNFGNWICLWSSKDGESFCHEGENIIDFMDLIDFLLFCIIHFVSYRLCVSYTFSSHPNCMQVILFAVAFIAIGGSGHQVRAKVLTTSQGHHSKSKVCTEKICSFHPFLSVQFFLCKLLIFTAAEKGLKFCKLTKFRRVGGLAQAGTGPWGRASAASR